MLSFLTGRESAVKEAPGPLYSAPTTDVRRRAEAWLRDRIAKGAQNGLFLEISTIDPVLAELMLARNIATNRSLKHTKIADMAKAMTEGRFALTHQGIAFSRDGELIDGQNRLQAIIQAGRPVRMVVSFGAEKDTFAYIDTGKVRGHADALTINGESNTALLASAAMMVCQVENGSPRGANYRLSNDEILDFVEARPALRSAVRYAHAVGQSLKCAPTPVAAVAYFALLVPDAEDSVRIFFDRLASGVGVTHMRDPINVMRERILKGHYRPFSQQVRCQLTGDLMLAWNAFRRGKRTTKIKWAVGDAFPTAE